MKPLLLWHPDWAESRVLAVDDNAKISSRKDKRRIGYVGAVHLPMPTGGIRLEEPHIFIEPSYLPEFIPKVELFSPLDLDLDRYVGITPARSIRPSIDALLRLAAKIAVVHSETERDLDAPGGRRERGFVEWRDTKTNWRRKWLLAWLWPRLDAMPPAMEPLSSKDRAACINAYMAAMGWDDKITPATLTTEANRMGLFFGE